MKKLIARFAKTVKGVLTRFDRIVFKGTILPSDLLDPRVSSRIRNGRRVRSLDISGKDRQFLMVATHPLSSVLSVGMRENRCLDSSRFLWQKHEIKATGRRPTATTKEALACLRACLRDAQASPHRQVASDGLKHASASVSVSMANCGSLGNIFVSLSK